MRLKPLYQQQKALTLEEGRQQGREEGLQQGLSEGAEFKALQIARNLLATGMSVEQVANITELPSDRVRQLQQ